MRHPRGHGSWLRMPRLGVCPTVLPRPATKAIALSATADSGTTPETAPRSRQNPHPWIDRFHEITQ